MKSGREREERRGMKERKGREERSCGVVASRKGCRDVGVELWLRGRGAGMSEWSCGVVASRKGYFQRNICVFINIFIREQR
jgi:hypothetical protein